MWMFILHSVCGCLHENLKSPENNPKKLSKSQKKQPTENQKNTESEL